MGHFGAYADFTFTYSVRTKERTEIVKYVILIATHYIKQNDTIVRSVKNMCKQQVACLEPMVQ